MPLAKNASVSIDVIAGYGNHPRLHRNHRVGLNNHVIEFQLHPALAYKMTGILEVFESANQITPVRNSRPAIQLHMAYFAHDRIAYVSRLRRQLWLGYGARYEGTGWDKLLCEAA